LGWGREKEDLQVRRKENDLRFPCKINFCLTCSDGKIGHQKSW
jgi:hypothetical protein